MVEVMREVYRVLRPEGSLWLNLGDSYMGGGCGHRDATRWPKQSRNDHFPQHSKKQDQGDLGLKYKDLCMVPARVAIALQEDGWILRSKITLCKENPMPESIEDRPTSATEELFIFAKQPIYFFDAFAIKEKSSGTAHSRGHGDTARAAEPGSGIKQNNSFQGEVINLVATRNLRNWWPYAIEPTRETALDFEGCDFVDRQGVPHKLSDECPVHSIDPEDTTPCGYCKVARTAHFACVDTRTECLTQAGWKSYENLIIGEPIASLDLASERLRWRPLEGISSYSVENLEMIHAQAASLDMLLTTDHRCLAQRRASITRYSKLKEVPAGMLTSSNLIPTTAPWENEGIDFDPTWAELLGWYVAEGHDLARSMSIEISQSMTANAPHVVRLRQLLITLEADFKEATASRIWRGREARQTYFKISGYVAARLRELAPSKRLTAEILRWSERPLKALMDGLINGDEHVRKDDQRKNFCQKNRPVADLVQAVAIRLGLSATLSGKNDGSGMSVLYFTDHKRRSLRGKNGTSQTRRGSTLNRVSYSGIVWCPRTTDGTWVARRNGRVFITGNSFPRLIPRRAIMAGTSEGGCCSICGAPRKRIVEKFTEFHGGSGAAGRTPEEVNGAGKWAGQQYGKNIKLGPVIKSRTAGWKSQCDCNSPFIPCIVLDPFLGSGTTAQVCDELGRRWVGIDLSAAYTERIAPQRTAQMGLRLMEGGSAGQS